MSARHLPEAAFFPLRGRATPADRQLNGEIPVYPDIRNFVPPSFSHSENLASRYCETG
ncbi:hypothetical protein ABIA23_006607 [Sinorhizobium fredii]